MSQRFQLYQPAQDAFVAIISKPSDSAATASWIRNAALWALWQEINSDPVRIENQRSELLKKSRELSLLLPTTSLVVVESASQWEILKRKEKQSLNNHSALDFEEEQETPEPVWWLRCSASYIIEIRGRAYVLRNLRLSNVRIFLIFPPSQCSLN